MEQKTIVEITQEVPIGFLLEVQMLGLLPNRRPTKLQVVAGTTVAQLKAHLVQLGYWRRPEVRLLAGSLCS
jgi:hypothetical protein